MKKYTTILISAFYPRYPTHGPKGNSSLKVNNLNFDMLITSVSEQTSDNKAFSLYPNPAVDYFSLSFDIKDGTDLTLNIYNVIGELIRTEKLQQNQQQINIEDLNNGIYVFEIKSDGWSERQKLIIQR